MTLFKVNDVIAIVGKYIKKGIFFKLSLKYMLLLRNSAFENNTI